MTNDSQYELLRLRAVQAFARQTPGEIFESRRAIIGARTAQLVEDAEEARRLLIEGKEPSPKQLAALEYSIRLLRPAPTCNSNGPTELPDKKNPLAELWDGFRERLKETQVSIARLDRVEDPDAISESGRTPLGTGFIVGDGVLLTAAHVVDQLSYGTGRLESGQAIAEFFGYYGATGREPCGIEAVIAMDALLDIALLQLNTTDLDLSHRPQLCPRAFDIKFGTPIAVVGYPLEDPRNRAAFISIVFGDNFAVKRAAIGGVIDFSGQHFLHDCSTLGGNSGSPIFDLKTSEVCGVHVSGRALAKNQAVPGKAVSNFLRSHRSSVFHPFVLGHPKRSIKMSKRPAFDQYLEQLKRSDPEIASEFDQTVNERATLEMAPGAEVEMTPETIVLTKGRPVLDVKQGEAVLAIDEIESQIWKDRLSNSMDTLAKHIPAVGRIEIANHPRGVDWLGTGWLLKDNIVVTNRHVAEVFGHVGGDGFLFRPGFDGTKMSAGVDFLEEFDNDASHEFPVFKIVHIEKPSGPDIAFLRIEPINGQELPNPVSLASTAVAEGEQVAVIGYPARDPFFPKPDVMDRIFNNRYDKKRLAPGMVIGKTSNRVFHDCSTLGGNSGGEVVSLKTGDAVALHFAGTLFTKNHAVPADIVAQRLDDVIRRRPTSGQPRHSDEGGTLVSLQSRARSQLAVAGQSIDATIPIRVRIDLGQVSSAVSSPNVTSAPPLPVAPAQFDDDVEEITEARPEDYVDRNGYAPEFLGSGIVVPLPELTENVDDIVTFDFDGKTLDVLDYRNFSVQMGGERRLLRYSACNIDGSVPKSHSRKSWRFDPRIPEELQIKKECYGNPPKFSRGHMTRRNDPSWGTSSSQGNTDSMHVTNAAPQIQPFNAPVWLSLEDYALENAIEDDMRICVFTGPFLQDDDPIRFDVKIPVRFWKIIAFIHDETKELCATGYTMNQSSFIGEEEFVFGQHENSQRPIVEIEQLAGISFGPLADVDPMREMTESMPTLLTDPNQIQWR